MSLKIGIIGAGGMARYHVPGFRSAGADVVALADPDAKAREKTAATHGVEKTYASMDDMLASHKDLDAVSIITPNKFHAPLAIQALKAGKHVFCEKPPALNEADTRLMAEAATKAGRHLQFNFNNRARPETMALMDYINAGEFGTINSAQTVWARRYGIPGFGGWFTNKAVSGGGPVIDLLHMLDLGLYFMGYPEPEWVLAQTFNNFMGNQAFKGPWRIPDVEGGATDVETACHGFIRFTTGQVLYLRNSWAEMTEREVVSVDLQGTKAGGRVRRLFRHDGLDETSEDSCEVFALEHGQHVDKKLVFTPDEAMGRLESARNFVLALEGKAEALNDPGQAIKLMRVVDALYASATQGKPVQLA